MCAPQERGCQPSRICRASGVALNRPTARLSASCTSLLNRNRSGVLCRSFRVLDFFCPPYPRSSKGGGAHNPSARGRGCCVNEMGLASLDSGDSEQRAMMVHSAMAFWRDAGYNMLVWCSRITGAGDCAASVRVPWRSGNIATGFRWTWNDNEKGTGLPLQCATSIQGQRTDLLVPVPVELLLRHCITRLLLGSHLFLGFRREELHPMRLSAFATPLALATFPFLLPALPLPVTFAAATAFAVLAVATFTTPTAQPCAEGWEARVGASDHDRHRFCQGEANCLHTTESR